MSAFIAVPLVLAALFLTGCGVAAATRGWVLPVSRRHVRDTRLHGMGLLLISSAMCWHAVFGTVVEDRGTREWFTLAGGAILVAGILVLGAAQHAPGRGARGRR
ncbi:hypothetical protein ACN20G_19495 [Streptomyces sp. BI20]|uniref:hypothetical protein n=1 Tax=Streptomyces sp. BI20 TaxID=3403460 RepID=UPI003C71FD52